MCRFSSVAMRVSSRSATRVAGQAAGVAVGNARGELLEGDVGDSDSQHAVLCRPDSSSPTLHRGHPIALERHGIDGAREEQVVADAHRVPRFFGGPAMHPRRPTRRSRAEPAASS